jgi:hypothetical protein
MHGPGRPLLDRQGRVRGHMWDESTTARQDGQ